MKKGHIVTFLAGIAIGTVLGALVDDKDKKRIQEALSKQAARLRKAYENPIKEGAAKVKEFVKAHWQT